MRLLAVLLPRRAFQLTNPSRNLLRTYAGSTSSSASPMGATIVDQTKENNDPNASQRQDHKDAAAQTNSSEGRDDPMKQPDPQTSPERSTGIETQGEDAVAGEGGKKETGEVQKDESAGENMPGFDGQGEKKG